MQPRGPALPKLDTVRPNQPTAPVFGQRNVAARRILVVQFTPVQIQTFT